VSDIIAVTVIPTIILFKAYDVAVLNNLKKTILFCKPDVSRHIQTFAEVRNLLSDARWRSG
jgi:hypothetical protein